MLANIPTSQQSIRELSEVIQNSSFSDYGKEDYFQLKRDIFGLLDAYNTLALSVDNGDYSPIIGTGSPEGVETANYSLLYIDSSVPAQYYNPVYGADTGWIAL